jgi:hypothetical protein
MPRRPETRGSCAYCGEVITRRSVAKHLEKCPQRQETLQDTEFSSRPVETLWHLRVQDAYDKDFWFDLEMRGAATLAKLDDYLRAIWLECCDHLSMFTIGGWQGDEISESRKADAIFAPGLMLRHLYDFGTTSETDIKVMGFRKGKATTKHPIALLARNLPPAALCQECDQPAAWFCPECLYEAEEPGAWFLCDEHVKDHPHNEYDEAIAIVNSPRLGMCGYDGPAEPPY